MIMLSISLRKNIFKQAIQITTQINAHRGLASQSRPGTVAIVTGAAGGIGRAIALRLANDGFDVAINDLPASQAKLKEVHEEISRIGRRAFICEGDVTAEPDVVRLVEDTAKHLGSVDVMVANAGICRTKPLMKTTVDDWNTLFSVNSRGVFLCYKIAAAQMILQGRGGKIIGACSVAGKKGVPNLAAYSASKFAVRGLTQAAAQELAGHGITVNAYAPGAIETDLLRQVYKDNDGDIAAPSALGHNGDPEDVAGLVSYLASPQSRFVTGQSINIDGGMVYD